MESFKEEYFLIRKWLVIGIVFLFITISLESAVNFFAVKASENNDILEVTTQVCGIQGIGSTTVKLTRQQYKKLEQYLVDFKAQLNQKTTREEVVLLFNQAVVNLNMYGLLPKGISVKQAQKLVSGKLFLMKVLNLWKNICLSRNKNLAISNDVLNIFCYVYAHTQYSFEDNIWVLLGFTLRLLHSKYGLKIFNFLGSLFFEYSQFKPCRFMNVVWVAGPGIGGITYSYFTLGLLGINIGSDDFDSAYGFSGIKINLDYSQMESIYFGFSLVVT